MLSLLVMRHGFRPQLSVSRCLPDRVPVDDLTRLPAEEQGTMLHLTASLQYWLGGA